MDANTKRLAGGSGSNASGGGIGGAQHRSARNQPQSRCCAKRTSNSGNSCSRKQRQARAEARLPRTSRSWSISSASEQWARRAVQATPTCKRSTGDRDVGGKDAADEAASERGRAHDRGALEARQAQRLPEAELNSPERHGLFQACRQHRRRNFIQNAR